MFEGNEYVNVEGRSILELLWVEVGTKVGPCDVMWDGSDVGKIEG